jgi:hypothetical protein
LSGYLTPEELHPNHFAADRETAEKIVQTNPAIRTAYIHADLREPGKILDDPASGRAAHHARSRPVGPGPQL